MVSKKIETFWILGTAFNPYQPKQFLNPSIPNPSIQACFLLYIASIRSPNASFTYFRLTFMVGVTSPSSS